MGGRYFLTGVQLGILMSSLDESQKIKILQKVMDEQFVGTFRKEESEEWKPTQDMIDFEKEEEKNEVVQ